jgi:hypothetical protein
MAAEQWYDFIEFYWWRDSKVDYDKDRVDETILALLWLTTFRDHDSKRAWKGHDWEAMDRLHAKGYISDPKSKAKSVIVTEEGVKRSQELFEKFFAPSK